MGKGRTWGDVKRRVVEKVVSKVTSRAGTGSVVSTDVNY